MDLCLLLLLVLLHSLCQCDLPHWRLFRLRGLLRPLGLALGVKKASILSPLLKSTTQQRLSGQALHTLALSRLLPRSARSESVQGLPAKANWWLWQARAKAQPGNCTSA